MENPDKQFREHVTSIGFNLTLSKAMIIVLVDIKHGPSHQALGKMGMTGREVPTMNSLQRRGLVWSPDPKHPGRMALTDAGKCVYDMLKVAGIAQEIEAKILEVAA